VVVSNTAKFELGGVQSRPQSGKIQKDSFMSGSQHNVDPLIEEVEIE